MPRVRALPVAVLVLVLVAAACSSSGSSKSGSGENGGGSLSPSAKADLALAQSVVLRPSELSDYTGTPHVAASDIPPALRQKFARCMGKSSTVFDKIPGAQSANSLDFAKGTSHELQVTNNVEIAPKTDDIDTLWNDFSSDQARSCLEQLDKDLFSPERAQAQGLKFGKSQVSEFNVGVGDRSIGYSMVTPATKAGRTSQLDIDIVYVVRGRAGIELNFFNLGPNPDRDHEKALAKKVYDRIGDKAA